MEHADVVSRLAVLSAGAALLGPERVLPAPSVPCRDRDVLPGAPLDAGWFGGRGRRILLDHESSVHQFAHVAEQHRGAGLDAAGGAQRRTRPQNGRARALGGRDYRGDAIADRRAGNHSPDLDGCRRILVDGKPSRAGVVSQGAGPPCGCGGSGNRGFGGAVAAFSLFIGPIPTRPRLCRPVMVDAGLGPGQLSGADVPLFHSILRGLCSVRPVLDFFVLSGIRCSGPGGLRRSPLAEYPSPVGGGPGSAGRGPCFRGSGRDRPASAESGSPIRIYTLPDQVHRNDGVLRAIAGRVCGEPFSRCNRTRGLGWRLGLRFNGSVGTRRRFEVDPNPSGNTELAETGNLRRTCCGRNRDDRMDQPPSPESVGELVGYAPERDRERRVSVWHTGNAPRAGLDTIAVAPERPERAAAGVD